MYFLALSYSLFLKYFYNNLINDINFILAKMSLEQLRALYFKLGQKVFSGTFLHAHQNSASMEKILIDIFQEKMMDSIKEPK